MNLIKSKKSFCLLFTLITYLAIGISYAQDVVITTKQDTLYGKVRLYADTGVVLLSEAKDSIYIKAINIEKVELNDNQTILYYKYNFNLIDNLSITKRLKGDSIYMLGVADACKYYKNYKLGASVNFLAGMLVYPAIPVVLSTTLTKPSYSNLNIPKHKESLPPQYYSGYSEQAYIIKKRKMISNSIMGFGTGAVAALTIAYVVLGALLK